ncbi:uncharacterized protein LOC128851445 [Cuculus canorus]|uniref:uncharacterized protein LOC128851445 n=1 Tax=Cuculus canorus TaxID=55661 RepID=UPI0023AA293B|nr:uncharacterized protein LOC128851445 [Cuculus canorus]
MLVAFLATWATAGSCSATVIQHPQVLLCQAAFQTHVYLSPFPYQHYFLSPSLSFQYLLLPFRLCDHLGSITIQSSHPQNSSHIPHDPCPPLHSIGSPYLCRGSWRTGCLGDLGVGVLQRMVASEQQRLQNAFKELQEGILLAQGHEKLTKERGEYTSSVSERKSLLDTLIVEIEKKWDQAVFEFLVDVGQTLSGCEAAKVLNPKPVSLEQQKTIKSLSEMNWWVMVEMAIFKENLLSVTDKERVQHLELAFERRSTISLQMLVVQAMLVAPQSLELAGALAVQALPSQFSA